MKKLALLAFMISSRLYGFANLPEAERAAQSLVEWLEPDQYEQVYKNMQGWHILRIFRLFEPEKNFFRLLREVTTKSAERFTGRHVLTLSLTPDAKFVILSNIQGEFHSFVRILQELRRRKIVADNFKLFPQHFLILNGNIMGDSPYNIQVLSLALMLIKTNPSQAFYIRGLQEDKEYWYHNALGNALSFLFPADTTRKKVVRDFLNTLPLAVYLMHESENPVRISYYGSDNREFDKLLCKKCSGPDLQLGLCSLGEYCSYKEGRLSVMVLGNEKNVVWNRMKGLQWNNAESNWHLVSSPARSFRQRERFFYDAFAQIDATRSLTSSTISLFNNKRRSEHFNYVGTFNLLTGEKRT